MIGFELAEETWGWKNAKQVKKMSQITGPDKCFVNKKIMQPIP